MKNYRSKLKNEIKLSVIIIAQNEEEMIGGCLESVISDQGSVISDQESVIGEEKSGDFWLQMIEVIVADNGSTDRTAEIARGYGARVIKVPAGAKKDFSKPRNASLKAARGKWIFYLDADERLTPELKNEIFQKVEHLTPNTDHLFSAYAIPRRNFYLGQEVRFGGAWPDYVKRLFKKDKFKKWQGFVHEEPIFSGEIGHLKEPMIHLTHRDLSSMVEKTRHWTDIEADLLYQAGHPPVVWWRIFRMMATKFFERMAKQSAWRDGTVGWISALFETFNTFIIYARLWEKQKLGDRC